MAILASARALWSAATVADRVVSIGLIVASIGLAAGLRWASPPPETARVTVGDVVVARLPLDRSERIVVEGRLGAVVVAVENGAVRVVESGCPQQLCVAMGEKRRSGEMVACVPNALVVRLEGGPPDPDAPDAVSR